MAQGDQGGAGGGGGKKKNRNRNRNRNKNKQANATNQQSSQPTQETSPPVSVHSGKPAESAPVIPAASAPIEPDTIAAQHQLPIFDSSSKTFVTNTFLPSYATVNVDSGVVDDGLPDVGTLSSSDDEPPKTASKQKGDSPKQSDNAKAKINESEEDAIGKQIIVKAKELETKMDDIERQNKLIGNLTMELNSRPDLGNWPAIKDAERNYVNTLVKNKKNKSSVNGGETSEDDFEHVAKWSQEDESNLAKKKEVLKDKTAELVKNLKLEMSADPYLANWAQLKDAETRLSSNSKNTQKEGSKKPSKGKKNKVRQHFKQIKTRSRLSFSRAYFVKQQYHSRFSHEQNS